MIYKPLKGSAQDEKKLENLTAENDKMKNMLEYVALMSDIEIPTEQEETPNVEGIGKNA